MAKDIILPQISVVMPVYNGGKYLREAIDSILDQTFKDFELLLLNDCSTDKSEDIILSYDDPRIVYLKNEQNLGLIKTLNIGLDLARAEYIARMDQDDISMPTRFEKQITFLSTNPDIGVCGTSFTLFDENAKTKLIVHPSTNDEIKIALLNNCSLGHPTVMMRKKVVGQMRYDEDFQAAEDYEFWTRLSRVTKLYNIQESLLKYRYHDTNMSVLEKDTQAKTANKVIGEQLEFMGFENNEDHIKNCKILFSSVATRLTSTQLMKVINFANQFEKNNHDRKFYDSKILKEIISKNLLKALNNTIKDSLLIIPFLLRNRTELIVKNTLKSNLKMVAKIILKR